MPDAFDVHLVAGRINTYTSEVADPATDVPDGNFWGEDGFSFGDIIDVINPLQHLPLVSSLYRSVTGDEISPGAQIAGGGLFGGPVGAFVAVFNVIFEEATGGDMTDQVLALFDGDGMDTSDGASLAFDMASGHREDRVRVFQPIASGSSGQQTTQTASLAAKQSGPDRGATDLNVSRATATDTAAASEPVAPVVALAEAARAKVPPPSPAERPSPVAGVWLSSIPQVASESPAPGTIIISPATAQLLLQAIGYPLEGGVNPRTGVESYEQRLPVPVIAGAAVDSRL